MYTYAGFTLTTQDVPRLSAFYRKLLRITSEGDDVHQEMGLAGSGFAIYNNGMAPDATRETFYIVFDVEDVDDEYARLQAMDVTVIEPPTTRPWGLRNMIFLDPDGNHVVFRSRPEKD